MMAIAAENDYTGLVWGGLFLMWFGFLLHTYLEGRRRHERDHWEMERHTSFVAAVERMQAQHSQDQERAVEGVAGVIARTVEAIVQGPKKDDGRDEELLRTIAQRDGYEGEDGRVPWYLGEVTEEEMVAADPTYEYVSDVEVKERVVGVPAGYEPLADLTGNTGNGKVEVTGTGTHLEARNVTWQE